MRKIWRVLKFAWEMRKEDLSFLKKLLEIHKGEIGKAAVWAVSKNQLDMDLKAAQNDRLRVEAIEWATAYLKENNIKPHPWELRVAIELAVGEVKDYWRIGG